MRHVGGPTTASTGQSTTARRITFCSAGCREKFLADPARYLDPAIAARPEPVPEGTIYTCPMHPEIRQVGPGSCPICGMALEPVLVTADAGPNPRARRHDAPVLDRARARGAGRRARDGRAPPASIISSRQQTSNWIQLLLATPVVLWAGWPFFVRGWQSLVTRNLNMFTLIAMGTGVAWVYSVVATLAPGVFPAAFRGHDGAVAVYFEAAAVITVLVLLGQVLELRAREQHQRRHPRAARPRARRPRAASGPTARTRRCSSTRVHVGDRLRVRPGEKVPVDGGSSKAAAPSTNRW